MATVEQLMEAKRRADEAGDTEAVQKIDLAIQQAQQRSQGKAPVEDIGQLQSALQGFGQGATFGFADEIGGALRAGLDMAQEKLTMPKDQQSDMPFSERYKMFRDDQRGLVESAREHNPWTTGIAEFVPGILQGGAGLTKAAGTAMTRKGIEEAAKKALTKGVMARSAGIGAGYGGVAGVGYGEGEGLGGMAADAAGGAAMGAGLGAAMPAVGAGLGKAGGTIGRFLGKSNEQAQRSAHNAARQEILIAMERDAMPMKKMIARMAEDPNFVIADAGDSMRNVAKQVALSPGTGGKQIKDFAQARAEGAYGRIVPELRKQLVNADSTSKNIMLPANFVKAERAVMERARQQAKSEGLWEKAYPANYARPRSLKMFLRRELKEDGTYGKIKDPEARRAFDNATRIMNIREMSGEVSRSDPGFLAQFDDEILRSLKSDIKMGTNPIAPGARVPEKSAVLMRLHRRLMDDYSKGMPKEWHKARSLWAGESANQDAMNAGLKILNKSTDVVEAAIGDMKSQSEIDHYLVGAMRAIEDKLSKASETGDILRTLRSTHHGKQLMRMVFGGQKGLERFLKKANQELNYLKLHKKVTGGSDTVENLAHGIQKKETGGGILGTLIGIPLATKLGLSGIPLIGRYLGRRVARAAATNDELKRNAAAKMLLSRNPQQLTQNMLPAQTMMPRNMTIAGLGGATQLPGLLNNE